MPEIIDSERKISLISRHGETLCRFWYGVRQFDEGTYGYFLIKVEELDYQQSQSFAARTVLA